MKKKFVFLTILAMVLVFGLIVTACGDGSGDNGNGNGTDTPIASFAGTWNASGGRSIVFSGSNFTYKVNGTTQYSGTFSVSGSKITFKETMQFGGQSASGNFTLSGTTLTLSNHTWDSSVNGTYTKNGGSSSGTAPTVTTATLSGGTVGTAYSQTLTATGDMPITWSIESGTLPTGLTLSTAGVISGNPTTANTFTFTVKAANAKGNNTKPLSITIASGGGGNAGTYIITKNGTQYTATKNGATVVTDIIIQPIIDEIKTNASSANIAIQFGNGTDVLDIGSSYIQFMNSASKTWGDITLLGKITSRNLTHGTIHISENISVTINGGTVSQTESSYSNCEAIYNSGTLNITGGTIQAGTGAGSTGISNRGTLNITGGTITATGNGSKGIINTTATVTSGGVSHTLTGTTTINGGTVSATNKDSNSSSVSYAVQNVSGTVTITTPPTVIDKTKTYGMITWLP